jgi:membrane protein YdbS with pleckstrin-like domain
MDDSMTPMPPATADLLDAHLPPVALRYLTARSGIELATSALAGVAALVTFLPRAWLAPALILLAVVAILGFGVDFGLVNQMRMAYTTYSVSADVVLICRGRFFRRTTFIPTAQILNVECAQGPILRGFGLMNVKFVCITDVERLGPLSAQDAEVIRRFVLASHARHEGAGETR